MVRQRIRKLAESFGAAFRGVCRCIRYGRNFRIHIIVAAYTLALALAADFSAGDYALLFALIALVMSGEIFNTAIELSCDRDRPQYDELIRVVKDIAAGGVLVSAAISALCGILLFSRAHSLVTLLCRFAEMPWLAGVFALGLIPSLLFITGKNSSHRERKTKNNGNK